MSSTIINYDAEFCGRQPVHLTNSIQPHGVLLVVALSNLSIIQVSENIHLLFTLSHQQMIGKTLGDVFSQDSCSNIINLLDDKGFEQKQVLPVSVLQGSNLLGYYACIHQIDDSLIIEIDFADQANKVEQGSGTLLQINKLSALLQAATSAQEVCDIAAVAIKKLSHYDKVMIYWFDEEWNGKVVSQAMEPGMDDFLGLHFPASDIPKPVRDLYFKNAVRLIPFRDYEPVALYPAINTVTGSITDLSLSNLRSVAQVHIEYLTNLKVQSTLSARLVHHNKLWGLISCSHRTARYSSVADKAMFEILSTVVSSSISSFIDQDAQKKKAAAYENIDILIDALQAGNKFPLSLAENAPLLLKLLGADGCAIVWDGQIDLLGATPSKAEVADLVQWLKAASYTGTTQINALGKLYDKGQAFADVASGIVVLPILPEAANFIVGFRPEKVKNVLWGGNPNDAVVFEESSPQYHPRHSFATWRQTVKHTATPWLAHEIEMIEKFRNGMVEYALLKNNNELQGLNKEFKFVTDFIPHVIWSAGPSGGIDYTNQQWTNLMGNRLENSLQNGWQQLLHPDDVEKRNKAWAQAVANTKPYETEYRLLTDDGLYRWFLARAIPYMDSNNQVIKWYGSLTDIDEQKNIAQRLELEVEKRTRNLTQTNLQLKQANSDIMQFVNIASHDLQEPLRKIQIFTNLVKDQYKEGIIDKAQPYLDKMIHLSARMKLLINDLLSYTNLSYDQKFAQCNLNDVLEQTKREMQNSLDKSNAIITYTPLPVIECISEQMKLLFTHLISNSIKFVRQHQQPQINLTSAFVHAADVDAPEIKDGQFVKITYSDNGIGFEQQYADSVFQIFRQLHDSKEYMGTGIGLAIVKKIVDLHYGVIAAQSQPGVGTVFTTVLPVLHKPLSN